MSKSDKCRSLSVLNLSLHAIINMAKYHSFSCSF